MLTAYLIFIVLPFVIPEVQGGMKKMDPNRILPFSDVFYKVGEGNFSHFF